MSWRNQFIDIVCRDDDIDSTILVRKSFEYMPLEFYRYRSFNKNNLDALINGYEWLSKPDDYNDPIDSKMFYNSKGVVDYVSNKYLVGSLDTEMRSFLTKTLGGEIDYFGGRIDDQLVKNDVSRRGKVRSSIKRFKRIADEILKNLPDKLADGLEKYVRDKSLVCSFSTNYQNQLMWAHYADSHQGFCLEYDRPDADKFGLGFFLPVVYRESPVDVTRYLSESYPNGKSASKAFISSAMVKNDCWSYEDEWRYFRLGQEDDRKFMGFKPKRLLLGCKASSQTRDALVSACREIGLPMYEMDWSRTSFSMHIGRQIA